MSKKNKSQLILGGIFLLAALGLLINQIKPEWTAWINITLSWPVWIILAGAALMLIGLLSANYEMAVPACIVAGIGGILNYQNTNQVWGSWSYMWTLIPGFVGIGTLVSASLGGNLKREGQNAVNTILISLILFTIFAAIFGRQEIFNTPKIFLIIGALFLFGLWLIIRGFIKK